MLAYYYNSMMTMSGGLQSPKNKKIYIIGGAIIALLLAVAGYFFWQYMTIKNDPAAANKETITRVIGQVSRILQVPTDEEPQVAKVTDPAKLKDQPFFTGVAQDDYVLVYEKAKLAILYREKDQKLINVDHVELDTAATN